RGAICTGSVLVDHKHVEHVELIVELDVVLDTVLVEGLKNHVTCAVGSIAGATNRGFTVIACVATETTLVNLTFGRTVERQSHLFQVPDRVDGFFGHDLGSVLVHDVVATCGSVACVPFPVVFFNVCQSGTHATLCCAGV